MPRARKIGAILFMYGTDYFVSVISGTGSNRNRKYWKCATEIMAFLPTQYFCVGNCVFQL